MYSRHPPNLAINYYLPTFNDSADLSPDYLAMQELENPPEAGVGCSPLLELGTVNKRHASNEFQAHFSALLREQYVLDSWPGDKTSTKWGHSPDPPSPPFAITWTSCRHVVGQVVGMCVS